MLGGNSDSMPVHPWLAIYCDHYNIQILEHYLSCYSFHAEDGDSNVKPYLHRNQLSH